MSGGIAGNATVHGMIRGVIDVSWQPPAEERETDNGITIVNSEKAEKAITIFRQSLDNSVDYEHRWFESGVAGVSKWMLQGTRAEDSRVKPALQSLIELLFQRAEEVIQKEEAQSLAQLASAAISDTTRQALDDALKGWAEKAHIELRDQLDAAFHRKSWRRIGWWKLFWRVDDIDSIASDILHRNWLVAAEKDLIWTAGRVEQAGFLGPRPRAPIAPPTDDAASEAKHVLGGFPPAPRFSDVLDKPVPLDDAEFPILHVPTPWPQQIALARHRLAVVTVPPLEALAQRLVLQTLATTALTALLSALLYVSVSTTSVYEAGAIAAFGLVYSMRRLQRRWEGARGRWEGEVREEGRRALRGVEEGLRGVVREGGRGELEVGGVEGRRGAREAVEGVREALRRMG